MTFTANSDAKPVEMFPGIVRRTLASGDRTTIVHVTLDEGAVVPMHSHPHEQIGYVAAGRLLFEVGGETRELSAGDGYLIPSGTPHKVTAIVAGVAIDVFSPPREEYLDR